ncbi:unnamed protein product [Oikopleura dioica]|uniref:Uncharacterized protein n=1 Tax=Oikopleura dioica TaxID=34765 RepID=E4WY84_OIKDI|nr:unnamed protein product [Oikopleura dioica]
MGAEVLLALRKSEDYAIAQYKLACLDEFIWLPALFLQECAEHKLDHEYKQLLDNMWDYISDDTKIELNGMTEGVLMHTLHHPEIDKSELIEKILWMNLISESSESHGSMIGIFGKKINNESNLLIARTLDGDFENPLREFPQITVYHGHDTKTVFSPTWTGKLGMTFGINEDGIVKGLNFIYISSNMKK